MLTPALAAAASAVEPQARARTRVSSAYRFPVFGMGAPRDTACPFVRYSDPNPGRSLLPSRAKRSAESVPNELAVGALQSERVSPGVTTPPRALPMTEA